LSFRIFEFSFEFIYRLLISVALLLFFFDELVDGVRGIFLAVVRCIFGKYLEIKVVEVILSDEVVSLFFFALFDSFEQVHRLVDDFI